MKSVIGVMTAFGLCPVAMAGLPAELDGSWYNPEQSGHGITLERVDAGRAVLLWHVFDPQGSPLTVYVDGRVEGDRIEGEAFTPQGMRFGVFDPIEFEFPPWGEVDVEFVDCNNAELRYQANDPSYGSGAIPLTRLLPIEDPDCSLQAPSDLRPLIPASIYGSLSGAFFAEGGPSAPGLINYYGGDVNGLVAANGTLRIALLQRLPISGLGAAQNAVMIADPVPAPAGQARFQARVLANGWLNGLLGTALESVAPAARQVRFPLQLRTVEGKAHGSFVSNHAATPEGFIQIGQGATRFDLRPGRYSYTDSVLSANGGSMQINLELRVDGSDGLCLQQTGGSECLFAGRVTARRDGEFDFVLTENRSGAQPFVGSGYSMYRVPGHPVLSQDSITLIGDNGETGLYLFSGSFTPL